MFIKTKQILAPGKKPKTKTRKQHGEKTAREKFRTNKKQHYFLGFEVKQELGAGCYKTASLQRCRENH